MRRWSVSLAAVGIWALAAPGLASAAQTFSISNSAGGNTFPANGNVPYTTTMNFDQSAGSPTRALITTSPGVLAALSANPSCLQTRQIAAACQIGSGTATLGGIGPVPLNGYLVPANDPANDVAGVDLIAGQGTPAQSTTHAEIQLKQNSAGNVSAVLNVDFSGAGAAGQAITGSSLTVSATVNGKQFTRMPSNCSPGPSSLTVQYSNGSTETTAAGPDFSITGCSSLPYAPKFSAVVTKDAGDSGVKIVTSVTQGADEAASAGNALTLPWPAVAPNFSSLSVQNTATAVGSVTAVSPLLPTALTGSAYLTGTPLGPTLTLKFPPPNALQLVGTVNLPAHTVVFNGVPDVPQTSLVVTLYGGSGALESTTCNPPTGTAAGTFTGQNGKKVTDSESVTVIGCPAPKPSLRSASLTGLKHGKPALRFTVARGAGGAKLVGVIVSAPRGLRFDRQGVRRLKLRGVKLVRLRGGKLTVVLRAPANTISIKLTPPLLVAGKHPPTHPRLVLGAIDTRDKQYRLTARL